MAASSENDGREGLTAATWWNVDLTREPRLAVGATPLVKRCMRAFAWNEATALRVLDGYRKLLTLKVMCNDYDAKKLIAPISVEQMWHQHILDTSNYGTDCQLLFGRFMHHDPDRSISLNVAAREKRIEETKCVLRLSYGETYDEQVWNFGTDAEQGLLGCPSSLDLNAEEEKRGIKRPHPPESSAPHNTTTSKKVSSLSTVGRFSFVSPADDAGSERTAAVVSAASSPSSSQDDESKASPTDETLKIKVRFQDDEVILFKINKTTRMARIMETYARWKGMNVGSMAFLLNGSTFRGSDTAEALGLMDQDEITVSIEQDYAMNSVYSGANGAACSSRVVSPEKAQSISSSKSAPGCTGNNESSARFLTVKVRDTDGVCTVFRVKETARMEGVFRIIGERKGMRWTKLRLLLDGCGIPGNFTPRMLQLKDGDIIDLVYELVG